MKFFVILSALAALAVASPLVERTDCSYSSVRECENALAEGCPGKCPAGTGANLDCTNDCINEAATFCNEWCG